MVDPEVFVAHVVLDAFAVHLVHGVLVAHVVLDAVAVHLVHGVFVAHVVLDAVVVHLVHGVFVAVYLVPECSLGTSELQKLFLALAIINAFDLPFVFSMM